MNRLSFFLLSLFIILPSFAQNSTEQVNSGCLDKNFNNLGVAIVRNDDVSTIQELIKKIPDINVCSEANLLKQAIDWESDEPKVTQWFRYDSNDIFSDWPDSAYQFSDKSPHIFSQKEQNNIDIIRSLIKAGITPKDRSISDAINKRKTVIIPDLIRAGAPLAGWELRGAISNDSDKETIKALLDAGLEVDYNDHGHDTALLYAIYRTRADIIDLLLNAGADPNFGTDDNYAHINQTPLMLAVSRDEERPMLPIVKKLIDTGADINAYNEKDHLYVIGYAKKPKMVRYLLNLGAKGALISAGFWKIATPEDVKKQIQKGEDVNAYGYDNKTPLNYAYMFSPQKEEMVELLRKHGAKGPHLPWDSKMELNPKKVVKQLNDGANPNMGGILMKAIKNNDLETTRLLLEGGADPNIYEPIKINCSSSRDYSVLFHSPLALAIENNNPEMLKLLLKHGANLKHERNILIYRDLPIDIMKLLIENGADPNVSVCGLSPLQKALNKKDIDLFEYLLKHGADINAKINGKTLLMKLVSRNAKENLPLLKKMLDLGADINLTDMEGHNVLTYVDDYRDDTSDVIEFLVSQGANINHRDNLGRTPLMNIVKRHHHDNQKNIRKMVDLGADVTATDNNEITVLDLAIANNKGEVIDFLVEKGAKESPKHYHWVTPRKGKSHIMKTWQDMTLNQFKEKLADSSLLKKEYFWEIPKPQVTNGTVIEGHLVGGMYYGDCAYGSDGLNVGAWCVPTEQGIKENLLLPPTILPSTNYAINQIPDTDLATTPQDTYNALLLNATRYNAKPEIIRYLIELGADVNVRDENKMTPIMWASLDNANPETLELLVQAGANINARAKNGKTAIYYAIAGKNKVDIIQKLLDLGANVNVRDEENIMPLDLAFQIDKVHIDHTILPGEVAKYLIKIGAEATSPHVMCWCELSREKGTESCASYIV